MRRSYLDYAMSVIVARALPDARDGLKPVHRRILFGMQRGRLHAGPAVPQVGPRRRRRDGQVPSARRRRDLRRHGAHGAVVLDARAADRRAGQFRLGRRRYAGGDALHRGAAGPRRDRCCWTTSTGHRRFPAELRRDREGAAASLPARFPNLLINGGNGIAVGMATNIPPHNPGEIIDATLALIADPDTSLDELMQIVPGPDFPTGGIIIGRSGIRAAFETGRGSIIIRARAEFEEIRKDREAIIVTEIPYQVNKNDAAGAHRRTGARQADRGHRRDARRERPLRHAHRHRTEARRDARGGAEPVVPLHPAADHVRHQHAGAGRRPAAADGAEGRAADASSASARR